MKFSRAFYAKLAYLRSAQVNIFSAVSDGVL